MDGVQHHDRRNNALETPAVGLVEIVVQRLNAGDCSRSMHGR